MNIVMYRGLALSDDDVVKLRTLGIEEHYYADTDELNVTAVTGELFEKKFFSREDVCSKTELKSDGKGGVYRVGYCGKITYGTTDIISAAQYALRNETALKRAYVLTFQVDVNDIYIDGRDFLYTIFSVTKNWTLDLVGKMARAFGTNFENYLNKIKENPTLTNEYITLLCQDKEAIESHLKNDILIKGRYDLEFLNSFKIRTLIQKESVIAITPVSQIDLTRDILDNTLQLK